MATAAKTGRGQSEGVGLGDCNTLKASGKHQCLATLKQTFYRSCNPSNIRAMAEVGVAIAATSGRGHSEGAGSLCDCHTLQASGKHQCLATLKQTFYRSCNPNNTRAMAGVGVAIAATSGSRGHSEGAGSLGDCHTLQASGKCQRLETSKQMLTTPSILATYVT